MNNWGSAKIKYSKGIQSLFFWNTLVTDLLPTRGKSHITTTLPWTIKHKICSPAFTNQQSSLFHFYQANSQSRENYCYAHKGHLILSRQPGLLSLANQQNTEKWKKRNKFYSAKKKQIHGENTKSRSSTVVSGLYLQYLKLKKKKILCGQMKRFAEKTITVDPVQ